SRPCPALHLHLLPRYRNVYRCHTHVWPPRSTDIIFDRSYRLLRPQRCLALRPRYNLSDKYLNTSLSVKSDEDGPPTRHCLSQKELWEYALHAARLPESYY